MHPIIQRARWQQGPQALASLFSGEAGMVLLESARLNGAPARYSFVTARPFLTFRSEATRCEISDGSHSQIHFGNPWKILDALLARYEVLEEVDFPFPLGGCFGFWGFDLKHFNEPCLSRTAINDLELPDCEVGFYDSLVVFDHVNRDAYIVSTGLRPDGSRDARRAAEKLLEWEQWIESSGKVELAPTQVIGQPFPIEQLHSSFSKQGFTAAVQKALDYIHQGHIYQVNLAQRLTLEQSLDPWMLYRHLAEVSPAPFAAFLRFRDFCLSSSSPELFLRLSGSHIVTRPIKGTRPRSADPTRDAQLSFELQTSVKEMSELVMITDLLRNDLGRFCEYGSIQVPELVKLEKYSHVQHLVSTVEGNLRGSTTHLDAFSQCFPGGSISGAPKIRALQIIDELEPVTRGPYTGAIGYLGFNRETQMSITIRTAVTQRHATHFQVGAGIVADSNPEAEYDETWAKAAGFLEALRATPASIVSGGTPSHRSALFGGDR